MSHYATMVHNKAMELAVAGFGTRFKTYRKTPMMQVIPSDLPMLGIYILREQRTPMGNANHAEPKFKHLMTLGFSGAVHAETEEQNQLYELEQWMSELDDVLLTNSKFVNLTEGVTGMDRQSQYAKVGETTLFEIRVEMVLEFSSNFPPKVVDDFETLHVTTQFPDKAHADSGTPQIIREYEIAQNP
jgi:hypothetical protein